jgi:hypothetical protein
LCQSATRHDKQRQKFSGSPRPPLNHRGNKSPSTSTTRSPRGSRNIFHYPKHATSSVGANTQHVTSARVQVPPNAPATNNNDNRRITRSMLAQPSVPRVHKPVTPTNMPTESAKRERIRKRRVVRLRNATTPTSTSPQAQTRAQVATAAARVAPPSMSTRSRVRQSNVPPPSRPPGFAAAVMRQQRYQRGMVRLSRRITRLENEVNQAMAVMDADTGKLLNYRQLMRNTKYREA